ncbi:MAG: biotin/lipoyl-binding protein [Pyrinomonadaceae bacterium]|nr:biotin/lipoyl-binding protein [Pyrinomonadaceae bacterium]MCX7638953.1 biotin/lipoyl-binding protein [Pyrinomonadaceae bacterium]MDW8304910.1 biotin/lipoyl-containing protein [Acidobacteriota bacterium]
MKLIAEIEGERQEIEIKREEEKVIATIEGRHYELEASEVEPDVYLLKHENLIYEIYVAPNDIVHIRNHELEVKMFDPKALRVSSAGISGDGIVEIKTSMPGKVVRVLVQKGGSVKRGDGIVVVEAMKMQNEMKSPKDGIVREIRFSEGDTVNAGEILAIIE